MLEEQVVLQLNLMPLMKAKRAICKTMQVDGEQIMIGKDHKKVFCVNEIDL